MTGMDMATSSAERSLSFLGSEDQIDRYTALQQELLDAYEHAGHAWLGQMRADLALWSELAEKLALVRTVPEEMQTHTRSVSQRLQAAAEEGRHLLDDCEQIAKSIGKLLANGRSFDEGECASVASLQTFARLRRLRAIQAGGEKQPEKVAVSGQKPHELAKLILKLRWIGMDEEAQRLQLAMRSQPPEQQGTVPAGPFSTD